VERQDVRVGEPGGDLDLLQKPPGPERGGDLGPQQLDGHPPLELHVFREVHRRHAPLAQLANEGEPVGEGGNERGQPVGWQGRLARGVLRQ